jgi:ADP-heptose:LPS heptosyltransferase
MGDIVLTTPVIRCLASQLPNAEIHYLTKDEFKPLLAYNPYIHSIHTLSDSLSETLCGLRKIHFDAIIDLHHNLRSLRVKQALNSKAFSFPKRNVEKWLLVNSGIDLLGNEHVIDRYFKSVEPLGVRNDGRGADYFLSPDEELKIEEFSKVSGGYYVLAIGAKFATKALPDKLVNEIIKGIDSRIYIVGGSAESSRAKVLASRYKGRVQSLCGRLSVSGSAALIRAARVLITPDTGMMHIGAALNVPVVSIWGSTVPAFGMTPYMQQGIPSRIIQKDGLNCRPCSKIGFVACPRGHFDCMNQISAVDIIKAAQEIARPI